MYCTLALHIFQGAGKVRCFIKLHFYWLNYDHCVFACNLYSLVYSSVCWESCQHWRVVWQWEVVWPMPVRSHGCSLVLWERTLCLGYPIMLTGITQWWTSVHWTRCDNWMTILHVNMQKLIYLSILAVKLLSWYMYTCMLPIWPPTWHNAKHFTCRT